MRRILVGLAAIVVCASALAQNPAPPVVQSATSAPGANAVPMAGGAAQPSSTAAILQMLQQIKAANEETLRKQAATLQQLDELEKAAEQIKIYTKRS